MISMATLTFWFINSIHSIKLYLNMVKSDSTIIRFFHWSVILYNTITGKLNIMLENIFYKWYIKTKDRDIWGSANYSFSDSLRLDKQFDTRLIFNKIEATLYFDLCASLEFNLDLQNPVTCNLRIISCIQREIHYYNPWIEASNLIYVM